MFRLIKAEDLKQTYKSTVFGTDFDYLIDEILIPAVTLSLAQYCKRPDWDSKSRTEYFSPAQGTRRLFLQSPPVATSPALQLWQDTAIPRAYGSETALINGTDFFVFEDQGVIERIGWGCWAWGQKAIKVTYTGGYLKGDSDGCPADLKLAAITQTKILFDRREQFGLTGQSIEGGSVSLLTPLTLPRSVTMMLDSYRVWGTC